MSLEEVIAGAVEADEEGHIWSGKTYDVATAVRAYINRMIEDAYGDLDYVRWQIKE